MKLSIILITVKKKKSTHRKISITSHYFEKDSSKKKSIFCSKFLYYSLGFQRPVRHFIYLILFFRFWCAYVEDVQVRGAELGLYTQAGKKNRYFQEIRGFPNLCPDSSRENPFSAKAETRQRPDSNRHHTAPN